MAISPETLGKRLREVRTNRGITQEQAAEAIGVPRTAIVHFEAGNRVPSTLQLAKLAEFYKQPIWDFFSEGPIPETAREQALVSLRVAEAFQNHPRLEQEVSRCIDLCQEAVALEELLGKKQRTAPPRYTLAEPRSRAEAANQGAQVAGEERRRLGLADVPIHALAELLSNEGVWVAGAELPDEMSGLFLQEARIGMVILVNQGHARPRKRSSYAHEYGHALMDRNRAAIVSTSGNSRELSETRANSFAAAFLMPEGGVRSYLANLEKGLNVRQTQAIYDVAGRQGSETEVRAMPGSQKIVYQDAASLARYFGVSYQAAVFRLRDLGVINQGEREALLEQEALGNRYLKVLKFEDAVDSGQYAAEGQREERELISRVAYLAIEAFRREEITGQRVFELAEKLQLDGQELLDLAEAARR